MVAVIATGERMSWSVQHEYPAAAAPIVSLVGGFDIDKAFDIAVVYEDFENYSDNDPESTWDLMRGETALSDHLRTVEERLMCGAGERPNEILHMVVIAGCGRPYVLGSSTSDVVMPQLPMSLENFHQIGMATLDPLRVWKFARAGERLREYCTAFAFSMIDEYAAWSETESYYFGDDARPTLVTFDPSYGRAHREKVARDTDVHGVVSPQGGWTEVVRLHEAPHIPIYGLLNGPGDEALMLVEGAPLPVWVRAADFATGTRRTLFQLVDCLAYWLWQTTPSLAHLGAVGTPRVIVDIVLSEPELWSAETTEAGGVIASTESPAAGILRLIINPSLRTMLDSPDNAGERALVAVLLNGLDALLPADARVGEGAIDAAVERHAPIGPKKKISVFTAATEVTLVDKDLRRYRRISRADTEAALDEAGEHLGTTLNLPVAEIPSDRKTKVLHAVVEFHFAQLEREVAALSPAGLLEHLVSMHEAILHHEAVERRTLGARVAAFGDTELLEGMRRELQDATQVSVALRFLIEYVAARPPRGLRPFSIASYDRLVAVANQIVSRGMTSDIIHFKVDDPDLGYLASRRLGLSDTGRFQTGQQSFLDAFIPPLARNVVESYGAPWRTAPKSKPPEIAEIDQASTAEWGFSMTELLEIFSVLGAVAQDRGRSAVSMPILELQRHITQELGWSDIRAAEVLQLLMLRSRPVFTKPPPGFHLYETRPWRFNRRLSYMRRPLLLRPRSDQDEVVWGMRQPEQAGRFLVDLVTSERLNANSSEMKGLMTRLRQAETSAFAESVADLCRDRGMLVETSVRTIGGAKISRTNGEDLGDIDILAIDAMTSTIYALECKDLEIARTPAELDNELRSTFRAGGTKRSAAEKHVERVAWIKDRMSTVLAHFDVEVPTTGWGVEGAIVTDVNVMSPHVAACPLPVYARHELQTMLERS